MSRAPKQHQSKKPAGKPPKGSKQAAKNSHGFALKQIRPKTYAQEQVFESFYENHLMLRGCPGTGKTFLALYLSLREILEYGHVSNFQKVIIIRSAVQTRDLGFMPGSLAEKIAYFETPYKDIVNDLMGRGDAYDILKNKGVIDFMCTSFVRGLTMDNAIILVDEAQNNTGHELDSIITRVGENTKIVFAGDFYQSDLKGRDKDGFKGFVDVLDKMGVIETIEFTQDDIVRSPFVKAYIIAREEQRLAA